MRNAYRSHLQRGDKTVKIKSQCCREMLRKVDVETKGERRRMGCETSEVLSEDDETDIRRMIQWQCLFDYRREGQMYQRHLDALQTKNGVRLSERSERLYVCCRRLVVPPPPFATLKQ